jgi:hypothetical protein
MKISNLLLSSVYLAIVLSAQEAMAYSPTPLTPAWFSSLKSSLSENTDNVWRGTVVDAPTPATLLLKNKQGDIVSVKLLHLSSPDNDTNHNLNIMNTASKSIIGLQVYVLGKSNKKAITAKILDMDGNDINLRLISSGLYDLNTASLFLKPEKQQYLNALRSAQRTRIGIWKSN